MVIHSILVSKRGDDPLVMMKWLSRVSESDVIAAFEQVDRLLSESDEPCYVLFDITSSLNFPISATLKGAAFGPYRNPHMIEWLIVGSNPIAHLIERTLTSVTGRDIVRWFENEAQALAHASLQ